MKNLLILFSLLCSISITQAQVKIYADPLAFNGNVKSVKMYITYTEGSSIISGKCTTGPDTTSYAYITYHPETNSRTLVSYNTPSQKCKSAEIEQVLDDTTVYISYTDVPHRFYQYAVSTDKEGNKVIMHTGFKSISSDAGKNVTIFDGKRENCTRYYSEGELTSTAKYVYNNDGSLTIERMKPDGSLQTRNTVSYNDHHDPIKLEYEDYDMDRDSKAKGITSEKSAETFEYTYDDKGNYTACIFYYNGKVQRVHHRDIVYE